MIPVVVYEQAVSMLNRFDLIIMIWFTFELFVVVAENRFPVFVYLLIELQILLLIVVVVEDLLNKKYVSQ